MSHQESVDTVARLEPVGADEYHHHAVRNDFARGQPLHRLKKVSPLATRAFVSAYFCPKSRLVSLVLQEYVIPAFVHRVTETGRG